MTCSRLASEVGKRGHLTYIHLYSALRAAHGAGSEGSEVVKPARCGGEFGSEKVSMVGLRRYASYGTWYLLGW